MAGLTRDGCAARRRRLLAAWEEEADALVLCNPRNVFHLTGLPARATLLSGWGINFLVLDREGRSTLLVHNGLEEEAGAAHADEVIVWTSYDFTHPARERFAAACAELETLLGRRGLRRIAAERGFLPAGVHPGGAGDLTPAISSLREVKDPDELDLIRAAIRAAEAGHEAARRALRPGLREIDLYAEVEGAVVRAAGEPVVMLCDLVAGARTERAGGPPGTGVIREGDLVIVDLFPVVGGYRADIANTYSCGGAPRAAHAELMAHLETALAAGEARLRPGARAAEVHEAVRAALGRAGHGEGAFSTHAGHGLGLDHPEAPYLVPGSAEVLREGHVVTLEPGLYVPGLGGARIEHDYRITGDGHERLSAHRVGL